MIRLPPASRALIIFHHASWGLRPRLYAVVRSADSQSFRRPKIDSHPAECLWTSGCDRAGTLVIHDNDAIRADYAFRHLEGRRDPAIREQTLSTAQRERIYHQPEHIDQIM